MVAVSAASAAVALFCALAPLAALYPAAVLAGLVFGGHWSLAPALAADLYGLRHFASNYCLLQVLRSPLSSATSPMLCCCVFFPALVPCHGIAFTKARKRFVCWTYLQQQHHLERLGKLWSGCYRVQA
jgi:MFS family permease